VNLPDVRAAGRIAALAAIPTMVLLVVSPLLQHPWTLGQHNWDQMNTQREVVVKTIEQYGQFPFWDPYTCGGHPAWGSLESAPIVVSPVLPAYLLLPLPIAIRAEIVTWAILGAIGCFKLASRFTSSAALKSLFTVITLLNSRWGMQVGAGHTWHLLYGLLPWAFFFFDRAIEPERDPALTRRDAVLAGVVIATMVYGDGIYPVPQTAFALLLYAAVVAQRARSWAPLRALSITGISAIGLAAPKLLPLAQSMMRFPRYIKSDEAMWPQYLYGIFTWREGDYTAMAPFATGMWHEWGLYIGWPALALLALGLVFSRGPRERALKWAGLVMLSFVLGGFHPLTPWRLLHLLPLFKSQHVPSRWLYASLMLLACAAVSGGERWLRGRSPASPEPGRNLDGRSPAWPEPGRNLIEALLGVAALLLAVQIGTVAREPLAESFVNPMPTAHDPAARFHLMHRLPPRSDYVPGLWDVATLPGVLENVGTLECDTDNGIHVTHRNPEGRMKGVGAFGDSDLEYRGEAYDAERAATVTIASFTPNAVEVHVEGAQPGDHIVLNQNWDPGWKANGGPTASYEDAVSTVATSSTETVRFRYWPASFVWGLAFAALTAVAAVTSAQRSPRSTTRNV
jgi:hypothetical protein